MAIYVAKYATKTSSDDPRFDIVRSLADLPAGDRPRICTAWSPRPFELGADPAFAGLNLARYAHRLGFGGHFLTKSRSYSTTFGALRDARVQWRGARRFGGDVPADHSFKGHWCAVGAGWANEGESLSAASQQQNSPRRRKRSSSGTPERNNTLFRSKWRRRCGRPVPFHVAGEQAGMSSLDKQPNGRWRARYRDKAGRSHSKPSTAKRMHRAISTTSVTTSAGANGSTRSWHVLVRAVGRPVVGDDHEAAPDHSPWVLGHAPANAAPTSRVGHVDIGYMDVEEFITHLLGQGLSPKYTRDCVSVLSLMMKSAVRANLRKDNPAADHTIPLPRRKLHAGDVLNMEQIHQLVAQ